MNAENAITKRAAAIRAGRRSTDPLIPVSVNQGIPPATEGEMEDMQARHATLTSKTLRNIPTPDPRDPFGIAAKDAARHAGAMLDTGNRDVVHSVHGDEAGEPNENGAKTMTTENLPGVAEAAKRKQDEADRKAKIAAEKAQAKADAKAQKEAQAKAKKDEADKLKAEAKAKRETEAAARKAEREKKQAEAIEARKAAAGTAEGARERTYFGSMTTLADRVKSGQYVKSVSGSLRCGDDLAVALDSVPPKNVIQLGMLALELETNPYAHLNVGQQSMNLRNKMRGAIKAGKLTLDKVKELRDAHGLVVEPAPKAPRATAKPAAEAQPEQPAA